METRQLSDMDLDDYDNNVKAYSSFSNTQTSHHRSQSSLRTVQVHGTYRQRANSMVEEQHHDNIVTVEQQQKFNVSDQRHRMHPANRHVNKRNSSLRRRSTEQQEHRRKIFMENRRQRLQQQEDQQQWHLEKQQRQVQVTGSSNELDQQRYTSPEFLDDELNAKLHMLQVYENDQIDSKEQWEQAQLKLFEELQQLEQQALATIYMDHMKYMKLMDEKEKQKRQ